MSVKFIRTCNRCGKVIEERNDTLSITKHLPSTKSTSLEFHKANADGMYDLCEDCWEDFCQFMRGQLVCDISDREKDVAVYDGEPFQRASKEECQAFAEEKQVTDTDTVNKAGWAPEILELVREHNKMFQEIKDAEKKHIIDTAEETASKIAETVTRNYVTTEANLMDKTKIKLKPGTHTYHRWTKEEDQFIAFHSAGMTMNELANKFGVTLTAVAQRKSMILNGKVQVNRED